MPHDRFFLDSVLNKNAESMLEDEEMHHFKVMRIQEGETIELVNGRNQLAQAKVLEITKKQVRLLILDVSEKHESYPLILCQAIPRLNRLDTIVEKGTELGMTELWLFPGVLSERKNLSETQRKRLTHLTVAAMKQCGRLDLPKIVWMPQILEWATLPYPGYFGDTDSNAPLLSSVWEKDSGACFFVGPEAGFTEEEEIHLKLKLHVKGVKLHSNILRADTAPLVAVSLIQHLLMSKK